MAAPPNHGSKVVPEGEPNCLVGMAFVFTGELSSFSCDEAVDIAKRYGGLVISYFVFCHLFVVYGMIQTRNASAI